MDTFTYKDSGVDIDAGNELVKRLKKHFPNIGGFGGLYPMGEGFLVASADGVGTKLKIAFEMDYHESIGIDLVAMCVNDILTSGAKPLFFLDYFATSKLDVTKAEKVLLGIGQGCHLAHCVLLGGETAEMPGFYKNADYDLGGFSVGFVDDDHLIHKDRVDIGDVILGLPSSGFHSNGYSFIRKILDTYKIPLDSQCPFFEGTVGDLLLVPTKIYVEEVHQIIQECDVRGIAHITGGGLIENIPRMLPKGLGALIDFNSWSTPEGFRWIQGLASISFEEMCRTFNMGIGMAVILPKHEAVALCRRNQEYKMIGEVVEGKGVIWE